jgi:hypothetical protein
MPEPIYAGKQAGELVRQPYRIVFDPSRGTTVIESYQAVGPGALGLGNLVEMFNEYRKMGIACELDANPVCSKINATLTGQLVSAIESHACDSWQLLGNEIHKDIRELPGVLQTENNFPGTVGKAVKGVEWLNNGILKTPAFDGGAAEVGMWLIHMLVTGRTHYAAGQYVLRHTTNIPSDWQNPIFDNSVECTYTTGSLLAEIGSGWSYPCPPRLRSKIGSLPMPWQIPGGHTWGWRKLPSTETTAASNRIDVTQEYWLELWPNYIYPPV